MIGVILISAVAVTLTMGTIESARRMVSSPPGGTALWEARNWVKSPQKNSGAPASGEASHNDLAAV